MANLFGYHDGDWRPWDEILISPSDPGYFWGALVTERWRTFHLQPFRLERHLDRLRASCSEAFLDLPQTDAALGDLIFELIDRNRPLIPPGMELSIALVARPGRDLSPPVVPAVVAIIPTLIPQIMNPHESAHLISIHADLGVLPQVKHRSRLPWWIAARQVAAQAPGAEALFRDDQTVLETSTANLLLVIDETVVTPPRPRVLPGISLDVVEELCAELGLPFREVPLSEAALAQASEAFLSSTTLCLKPVRQIDGWSYPAPGPVIGQLRRLWSQYVGLPLWGVE